MRGWALTVLGGNYLHVFSSALSGLEQLTLAIYAGLRIRSPCADVLRPFRPRAPDAPETRTSSLCNENKHTHPIADYSLGVANS
jgi:hypothetical protein